MLSILIPTYNFSVGKLVSELHKQCEAEEIDFEIRCYDDGSTDDIKSENAVITDLPKVIYKQLPHNLGRSRIRNLMATEAAHGLLLFLDCDGGMIRQDFIATYLKHKTDKTIISGGREYARIRPTDDRYVLHWSYGSTKESRPLEERQAHPLRYFHSNNFLVERHTFLGVTFDETITSYGYEDLLFAQDAVTKGVTVRHIDNPVEHLDLQTNEVFLDKARMAIDNLIDLQKRGLNVETNLVGGYIKLKSLFLLKPFSIYYKMKEKAILENLRSTHPKLRNLDIYKLYYYMTSRHKKAPNK